MLWSLWLWNLISKKEQEENCIESKIKALIIKPNEYPIVQKIENTLKSLQSIVGGFIEPFGMEDAIAIVNEEGKILGLEPNRRYGNDILVGNTIIVGDGEEDFISLTEEQIEKYSEMFHEPVQISYEEIEQGFLCY